jgi:hypothetical protein
MRIRHRKSKVAQLITACCVCGRVREGDAWIRDTSEASAARTHTYCPECLVVEVRRNFPDSVKAVLALCRAS